LGLNSDPVYLFSACTRAKRHLSLVAVDVSEGLTNLHEFFGYREGSGEVTIPRLIADQELSQIVRDRGATLTKEGDSWSIKKWGKTMATITTKGDETVISSQYNYVLNMIMKETGGE